METVYKGIAGQRQRERFDALALAAEPNRPTTRDQRQALSGADELNRLWRSPQPDSQEPNPGLAANPAAITPQNQPFL